MIKADELRQIIGDEQFNQLVSTFEDTVRKGRFRFWQSELFEKIADKTGGPISFDQYVSIFGNAQVAQCAVSQEEFLQDPVACWKDPAIRFDPAWIKPAWDASPEFSQAVLDECLCSIALTDTLKDLSEDPHVLAQQLSAADAVQVFQHVAKWCCMPESDWRNNFLSVFASVAQEVPAESSADGTTLVSQLRDEMIQTTDAASRLSQWLITPRIVSTGIGDCWLLLETSNRLGLLYSPYGSLEPQHKWGVANDVQAESVEDQIWAETFADCIDDFENELRNDG